MSVNTVYRTRRRMRSDRKLLIFMVTCSLILHGGVVLVATAKWNASMGKERFGPVYSVDLVTLPSSTVKRSPKFSTGRKAKTVSRRQAIPIQRFRAKEQPLAIQKLQRAAASDEETEEVKPPEKTLTKLEQRASPLAAVQKESTKAASRPGSGQKKVSLENIGGMRGGELSQALVLYRALVNEKIERNWVYPEQLTPEKDELEAIVVVRARRDGTLTEIHFEKKSGNPYFDDSVFKAILKSKPFPPFPEIYSPKEEEIVIRFSPATVSS